MKKVKTNQLELNKPSELCQIVCMDEKRNLTGELTATQMDLMNLLLYRSREKIVKESIKEIDEFFDLDVELNYISSTLGLNSNNDYKSIVSQLSALKSQIFILNALGKNKDIETTVTSFIHKVKFTKHREMVKKTVRLVLDGEIIGLLINTKKFFSKMFLTIQFSMVSKYSKALYEILKDYEGIKTITIELDMINGLLNVDTTKPTNTQWSSFRPNVLEKAINEINEKSDIAVYYEPIKEKPSKNERLQVTKIKFNIEKQPESRLQELGLIQPSITTLPFYNKSKSKLDALVKTGYKVIDEDMWIETDIRKNEEKYSFETKLDNWIKTTPQDQRNDILLAIAQQMDDCEDHTVYIKDYRLTGIFSQEVFAKNAKETIEWINKIIDLVESGD